MKHRNPDAATAATQSPQHSVAAFNHQPAPLPLPPTGFIKLRQIIGDPKRGIQALFPVSRSGWYQGIKDGRFPAPVKLGSRSSAWRVSDVQALLASVGA